MRTAARVAKQGSNNAGGGRSGHRKGGPGGGGRPAPARSAPKAGPEIVKDVHDPDGIRLQKVLASAGLGSRRACEDLIEAGRVMVDGQVVRELGVRVNPKRAAVSVDGMRIQVDDTMVTLALNKPRGVVSTMRDPEGRPDLSEFVANRTERLFHVGRLDTETEGLLLLTNDGELAHRLAHPSYQVPKTYLAEVAGQVPRDLGKRLRAGIQLEDGPVVVDSFRLVDSRPGKALVEVVLHEGRNHIVRRLLDEVGLPVEQLVRTQIGPIRLGDLRTGRTRVLGQAELGSLLELVNL